MCRRDGETLRLPGGEVGWEERRNRSGRGDGVDNGIVLQLEQRRAQRAD